MIRYILIIIIGIIIVLVIGFPWISLLSLNGIEQELRKIRQIMERKL